ncbi:hypothetical protein PICMEDRAFT_96304 [Pichia membranifaciens NRRL Y-2026]|uniref:Uncharacterized protein n=1 Tax=Pichia membranifaciens NRRL Y-2026 TaxID=763406 RepID=A0A1E3NSN6_9ASCO|nr:hypothetical protein PICMEDRAFT_96304 [Pichia membranifaciens NRRL Y-2026]ODQ49167.1 hypothetical protein PICMEDRAFT_96304 [Pichia membranifaciens NRRL Y-2026]
MTLRMLCLPRKGTVVVACRQFRWRAPPLPPTAGWSLLAKNTPCGRRERQRTCGITPARGSSGCFLTHFLQLIRGTRAGLLLLPCLPFAVAFVFAVLEIFGFSSTIQTSGDRCSLHV